MCHFNCLVCDNVTAAIGKEYSGVYNLVLLGLYCRKLCWQGGLNAGWTQAEVWLLTILAHTGGHLGWLLGWCSDSCGRVPAWVGYRGCTGLDQKLT
jgi:hypothetical protein